MNKIVVRILVSIISLFFILILCILFLPIRYEITGSYNKLLSANASFKWLFGVFTLLLVADGDKRFAELRLFGRKPRKKKNKLNKSEPSEKHNEPENVAESEESEERNPRERKEQETQDSPKKESAAPAVKNKKKKSRKKRVGNHTKKKFMKWREYLPIEEIKKTIPAAMKLCKRLFAAVKPSQFKLNGEVGFDTPDITGIFLAIQSIIIAKTRYNILVKGNFSEKKILLNGNLSGSFTPFSLIWPLAAFVLYKPVREMLFNLIRKED